MASAALESPSMASAGGQDNLNDDTEEEMEQGEQEEQLTETEKLDEQIAAARDEIAALQHRRSTLSAHLLSNPPSSLQSILADPSQSTAASISASTIDTLLSRHTAQQAATVRSLYRLCTGATTFETRDPSPSAVDNGFVLGIRIEVFSSETGVFLAPYYLLLNRPWRSDSDVEDAGIRREYFKMHRHTFPPWVPVKEICRRWLPPPSSPTKEYDADGVEEGLTNRQDLQALTRELRAHIVSYHRREDAVRKMASDNAAYVSRVALPSAENLEAKVMLRDGSTTNIRLDTKGRILKVDAKDDVGRRLYGLERNILRMRRVENVDFAGV